MFSFKSILGRINKIGIVFVFFLFFFKGIVSQDKYFVEDSKNQNGTISACFYDIGKILHRATELITAF
jgi:hypothetical protein